MKHLKSRTPRLTIALLLSGIAAHAVEPGTFSPAGYASDGPEVNSRLIVFAANGREVDVPLPRTLRYLAYGAGGRTLYATAFRRLDARSFTTSPGILKIEFSPLLRVIALPGLGAFDGIDRFAVSRQEDEVLFVGYRSGGTSCGIYELDLPGGSLHSVVENPDCRFGTPWRIADLSPTAEEALITQHGRLASLDLVRGAIVPLGKDLWGGSYSPDGK